MTTRAAVPLQLPLIPEEQLPSPAPRDRLGRLTWSYSRRSTVEKCARRYYYEYYGASRRTAPREPDKDVLRFLKQLTSRHERTGSILHLVIAWYLREARKGQVPTVERTVSWARHLFAADREFSRSRHDGLRALTGERFPPALLLEYHYSDPRAEALCDEAEARLYDALTAFVTDAAFASLRLAGFGADALIEATIRLGDEVPCRVDGKVDLAFRSNSQVTVVDWKLGRAYGSGDDSLQLAVYALWAVRHFSCAPGDLRLQKAHLGSRDVIDFRADSDLLASACARIVQDAQQMSALHEYGVQGIAAAFSPCLQPLVCRDCPYRQVCPEGRELVGA
jgi:hypothetical protein